MTSTFLKLYIPEAARHDGKLLYEWVLDAARGLNIRGGSVFKAIAGYGRHGQLHEEHFFELAGELPVSVEFFADEEAVNRLLKLLQAEQISVFYVKTPAQGGLTL